MLTFEFDIKQAEIIWREESKEEGREEGKLENLVKLIYKKKLKLKTREQIIDELELEESEIQILDNFDKYTYLLGFENLEI